MESLIKLIHGLHPVGFAFGDGIKTLFRASREIVTQYRRELFHQEVVGDASQVGWQEFASVCTYYL